MRHLSLAARESAGPADASDPLVICRSPLDLVFDRVFHVLDGFLDRSAIYLKLEGMNPAGSIKLKPAIEMLTELEAAHAIAPGRTRIVESSSGNLGIALSIACKVKGYDFTCVSDPNINARARRYIELYGGRVIIVDKRDENGGFLHSRIEYIQQMLAQDSSCRWLNQYASPANKRAHYLRTAASIFRTFPRVDYLFVGAGTTGTLMGCVEYVEEHGLNTKVVAVDALGSVTFGFPPRKRRIPGLGTSRRPELVQPEKIHELVIVAEPDTVAMCHELLRTRGLLVGGSTGTVLAGVRAFADNIAAGDTVVAISPDFGDRYIDTIYEPTWLAQFFPSVLEQIGDQRPAPGRDERAPAGASRDDAGDIGLEVCR